MADQKDGKFDALMDKVFMDTLEAVVLSYDPDTPYTARELVGRLGVGNLKAARNLSAVLKRLGVRSAKELYDLGPGPLLRVVGVGNATAWVAMHVLEDQGYSVERWWGWDKRKTPKFSSYREHVRRKAQKKGGRHAA